MWNKKDEKRWQVTQVGLQQCTSMEMNGYHIINICMLLVVSEKETAHRI